MRFQIASDYISRCFPISWIPGHRTWRMTLMLSSSLRCHSTRMVSNVLGLASAGVLRARHHEAYFSHY